MANFSSPVQIGNGSWSVLGAGTGLFNLSAIDSTGFLYTWGVNSVGQLGSGTTVNRSSPVLISITQSVTSLPTQLGASSWTAVSAGNSHTMAIRSDSGLFGWGFNATGQVGDSTSINKISPVQIGSSSWTVVSAGAGFTQGTLSTGILYSWGINNSGQLGDSSIVNRSSPVAIGASSWTVLGTGPARQDGIAISGVGLWAWGLNTSAQLGDGTAGTINNRSSPVVIGNNVSINASSPVQVGSSSWTAVAAGGYHLLAIRSDADLFAWGRNQDGQLGDATTFNRSSPVAVGASSWTAIGAAVRTSFAVRNDATLWAWGYASQGQLGNNTATAVSSPVQIGGRSWSVIGRGSQANNGIGITDDATLWTWGLNSSGQLGDNSTVNKSSPVAVGGASTVAASSPVQIGSSSWTAVAAGKDLSVAIRSDAKLFVWGTNSAGQLGLNTTLIAAMSSPTQVGSSSWTAIAAGYNQTAAVNASNQLFVWGQNTIGQLGIGTSTSVNNQSSPVQVGANWSWTSAKLGGSTTVNAFALLLRSDSDLFGTGGGTIGQLGNQTTANASSPVQVGLTYVASPVQVGSSSWTAVAAGNSHSAAIRTDSALFTWGYGLQGQLGTTDLPGFSWATVARGSGQTIGIRSDGILFTWGAGGSGALGDNTTISKSSPVQIGTNRWQAVAGGSQFALAIRGDGALFAWGNNTVGQLGDATTVNKSSPVQIGSSSWTAIAAGLSHSVALRSDGSMWSWGLNSSGQVGDGSTINRNSPVAVSSNLVYYSNYFDGNGDYLNVPSSTAFDFGTGDFTIECWVNLQWFSSTGASDKASALVFGSGANADGGGAVRYDFDVSYQGYLIFSNCPEGGVNNFGVIATNNPLTLNTWTHVVVTRSNGINVDFFVNGVKCGVSGTVGATQTVNRASVLRIGRLFTSATFDYQTKGYISNLRITKGQALYTTNFTPSTAPLTTTSQGATASNVSLLTAQAPTFVDSSSNNFTITVVGNTAISTVAPFGSGTSTTYFSYISAGANSSMGISNNGLLLGWGLNSFGQLGLGDNAYRSTATQIGNDQWSAVSGGTDHTAAIRTDGALFTWGGNNFGQLGDNSVVNRSSPVQIGSSSWTAVSAGASMTAAIRSDSALFTWGDNTDGQVGDGTRITKLSPVQIGSSSWVLLAQGRTIGTNIALAPDRIMYAWGVGSGGQLGNNSTVNRSSPTLVSGFNASSPVQIGSSSWSAVGAGAQFTGATRIDKALFVWGSNGFGQLGTNTTVNQSSPVQIGSSSWSIVGIGSYNIAALNLAPNQALYVWGLNTSGQVGDNTTANRSSPVLIPGALITATNSPVQLGFSSWTAVDAGANQTMALRYDASLFAWGRNQYAQLGDGSTANRSSPVQIGSSSWTAVSTGNRATGAIRAGGALFSWGTNTYGQLGSELSWTLVAGGSHTVAVRSDGALFAWGLNTDGQIGNETLIPRSSPVQIGSDLWKTVDVGSSHTVAIASNGALFTWGLGISGQLGAGGQASRSSPVQIGSSSWTAVAGGGSHTVAIRSDGALFAWGGGGNGQLGNESVANQSSPVQIGSSSWTAVAAGLSFTSAIRSDGALFTWGGGSSGSLGDNTLTARSSPVQIGSSSWTAVAMGFDSTIAIRQDGMLFTWGRNIDGQLGDGTTVNKSSPVQIGSSSWSAVSTGVSNMSAIRSDGALFTWGGNSFGQLGDGTAGTANSRSSPVQIGSSSWTALGQRLLAYSTFALRSDTLLFTWGRNTSGQLADSTTVNQSSPVQIGTSPGWATRSSPVQVGTGLWNRVSFGGDSAAALNNNNQLFTWGLNSSGQLGDGTAITRGSPVQIGSSTSWTAISAGSVDIYGLKK